MVRTCPANELHIHVLHVVLDTCAKWTMWANANRSMPTHRPPGLTAAWSGLAAAVGVITETNAEKAIEELKAYEVSALNGGQLVVQSAH